MTGIYFRRIRQGEKLCPDTVLQHIEIASRQVGPPNASPEKDISADEESVCRAVKTDTARGMAGCKKNFEFIFPECDLFSGFEINQRSVIVVKRQLPHLARLRCEIEQLFFKRMQVQVQSPCLMHEFIAENVVEMAVGIQQQYGFQAVFGDKGPEFSRSSGK